VLLAAYALGLGAAFLAAGIAFARAMGGLRWLRDRYALIQAAMADGVSLAARGNLLILAPPLVIEETALANALDLIDRLLARFFPAHS